MYTSKALCSDCQCRIGTIETETCNSPLIADGYCHDETNNLKCNYDGGDCCGSCILTEFCSECICMNGMNSNEFFNAIVGDGFCNDETNNAACNYDGGDCCININTDHCSECNCYHDQNCAAGFIPSIVGDGYCNDETNTANCNYDGGDCCGHNVNTDFCSNCGCYFNETCVDTHPLVGDGFCNDETNHALCNYDLGDCCGFNVNNVHCSDCSCLGKVFSISKPTSLCIKEV